MNNPQIYELISKVMHDVGSVGKDARNAYDKYQYRSIDAVYNALQPALAKHKVFFAPEVLESVEERVLSKKGDSQVRIILKVKYTLYAPDGSKVECVVHGEGMDRSDKAVNKAFTAAFKYLVFQLFCISYEGMEDADKDSPQVTVDPNAIGGGKYMGKLVADVPEAELSAYINHIQEQLKEKGGREPLWFTKLKKQKGSENGVSK